MKALFAVFFFFISLSLFASEKVERFWVCDGRDAAETEQKNFFFIEKNQTDEFVRLMDKVNGTCERVNNKKEKLVSEVRAGKREGIFRKYDQYERLILTTYYKNGLMHGQARAYHPNGNVNYEFYLKDDQIEGVLKIFNEDGIIISDAVLKNGMANGIVHRYYDSGEVYTSYQLLENKREGVQQFYFKTGVISGEFHFADNLLNGTAKAYLDNGKQVFEINYINHVAVSGICFNGEQRIVLTQEELLDWQKVKCWETEQTVLQTDFNNPFIPFPF
ncbi:toxin-antitoxin system YwqK family antitoxin [Geovibrio thiophilus]|uniref:Toxin-antitoxin system YwqK family antitoxin n=1 Tax=Geovibrio thiophilus TaxID=139438 RepID=A0A410JYL5_9BACT|nr:toxin-antitoxin system YwqK family antitoxin [Geovibrio thiophilus]QAR33270.1 toxin-antitoxin system YwqK family antitoxin [Geovibrio thiophilus]